MSFRLDAFLWNGAVWGYHLTNILAHALSAWLVSQIAFALFASWETAALAGCLFALHPAAASAVAWVTGRNAGLVCLFLLFSTWFLLKFQASKTPGFLVLSLAAFLIAALTKEQAWVFPAFLLLLLLSQPDSATSSCRFGSKALVIGAVTSFVMALLLAPYGRAAFGILSTSQDERLIHVTIAASEIALACLGAFLLILAFVVRVRPGSRVLLWFLAVEALVIFGGLLPSQILARPAWVKSPFSFAPAHLSNDLYAVLSALGMTPFVFRDWLNALASKHPWLVGGLWVSCGAILVALVLGSRHRAKACAALMAFLIGLAPMRSIPPNFFELNNIYVAVPVVAITAALLIRWAAQRSRYWAALLGIGLALSWAITLQSSEAHLAEMGKFSKVLYAMLEHETRARPGPLQVIVNVPDPFHTAQDDDLAYFLVFRVAQAAMRLGGYTDDNVALVKTRVVQILATEDGPPCHYEARIVGQEQISFTRRPIHNQGSRCLSQLRFVAFTAQGGGRGDSVLADRRASYRGVPLTEANIDSFDQDTLRLVAGTRSAF